jgi:TonB family protein
MKDSMARSLGLSIAAHALVLLLALALPPSSKIFSSDSSDTLSTRVKFSIHTPDLELAPFTGSGRFTPRGEEGDRRFLSKARVRREQFKLQGQEADADPGLARRWVEHPLREEGPLERGRTLAGNHLVSIMGRYTVFGNEAEDSLSRLIGKHRGRDKGATGHGSDFIGYGGCGFMTEIGCGVGSSRVEMGPVVVQGYMDKELIRRVIRQHTNEIRYCYDKELLADQNLEGRVVLRFTISETGEVLSAAVHESTLGNRAVESCMAQVVRRCRFPNPGRGCLIIVHFPFSLHAGNSFKEIVRRVIRQHKNEIRYCYQKELQSQEDLAGRVVVRFTITPTGAVISSMIAESSLGNRAVESCIAQSVRRWLFPKPHGGGLVEVNYPFELHASGGG